MQKSKKSCGENLKIDDLFDHFRSMFSNDDDPSENLENRDNDHNIYVPDLDADITLEELKTAVFHQKNNASYGLDNVCTSAIKSSFTIISPFLLKLINQIF